MSNKKKVRRNGLERPWLVIPGGGGWNLVHPAWMQFHGRRHARGRRRAPAQVETARCRGVPLAGAVRPAVPGILAAVPPISSPLPPCHMLPALCAGPLCSGRPTSGTVMSFFSPSPQILTPQLAISWCFFCSLSFKLSFSWFSYKPFVFLSKVPIATSQVAPYCCSFQILNTSNMQKRIFLYNMEQKTTQCSSNSSLDSNIQRFNF